MIFTQKDINTNIMLVDKIRFITYIKNLKKIE